MSRYRFPSYVETVLAFLRGAGARIVLVKHEHRFTILWRFAGQKHTTKLPDRTADPEACTARALAEVRGFLGMSGAAV